MSDGSTGPVMQTMTPHPMRVDGPAGKVVESPRQTPVAGTYDVVVVGGGPAGVGAALAAASEGARTLIVERHGMLGGVWTAGLLNPLFDPFKGWIVDRLVNELEARGVWQRGDDTPLVFDTETMKFVLEQMMAAAGVDFWYHCPVADAIVTHGAVRGVITESKSGREAVLASVVIDCSGDGDLAARAGVPFHLGRESDGLCQPMTLMFEIAGFEALGDTPAEQLRVHCFLRELVDAIERHQLDVKLPYGKLASGAPYFIALPGHRVAAIQATHVYKIDAIDVRAVTQAIVEARRQVHEVFMHVLRHCPGLERLRLNQTAPTIGIREARHLEGQYRLELDDMLHGRRFDDAVTSTNFHIDIHEIDPESEAARIPPLPEGMTRHTIPMCDIPYRCLVPRHVSGLLFAGRCISGSHHAHASYRVTGTCMATGQAAGLAAALAAKRGCSPHTFDGTEIHALLADRGVRFLSRDPSVAVTRGW